MLIRRAEENDVEILKSIATAMKARHEADYFGRCLAEQADARRTILLAEESGRGHGYVMINWLPLYPPFRRLGIPEIQDLNVVPEARRQGLGAKLVDACEDAARQAGKTEMGISVGLGAGFGAAQRLYVRRGYIPDGAGVMHDELPVTAGEMRPVDDMLTLKLVKIL
ncbi:MAG: N-acetyltransferase family protein [Alphaproteobacteria bacterium]